MEHLARTFARNELRLWLPQRQHGFVRSQEKFVSAPVGKIPHTSVRLPHVPLKGERQFNVGGEESCVTSRCGVFLGGSDRNSIVHAIFSGGLALTGEERQEECQNRNRN